MTFFGSLHFTVIKLEHFRYVLTPFIITMFYLYQMLFLQWGVWYKNKLQRSLSGLPMTLTVLASSNGLFVTDTRLEIGFCSILQKMKKLLQWWRLQYQTIVKTAKEWLQFIFSSFAKSRLHLGIVEIFSGAKTFQFLENSKANIELLLLVH